MTGPAHPDTALDGLGPPTAAPLGEAADRPGTGTTPTGSGAYTECPTCGGHGEIRHPRWGSRTCPTPEIVCPTCHGNGEIPPPPMTCCGGYPGEHFAGCWQDLPCTCGTRRGCHTHGPEPRHQATTCSHCLRQRTWNLTGICDHCTRQPEPKEAHSR